MRHSIQSVRLQSLRLALPMIGALLAVACGGGGGGDADGNEAAAAAGQPGALGAVTVGEGEPIKIASLNSISGEVASLGTDQVRAIEIAIEDRGQLLGHDVQLVSEDELCNAEGGTTGAQKIVSDPQIVGIIGTSCSGAGVPASQIMSEAGYAMISGSNTSPALTSLGGERGSAWQPGYFRTAHNDEVQGRAAATFAIQELGITKAASIHDGDPYTQGLTGVFNDVFQELGGELVLATAVNKGDTDMKPVLTEIAAAGAELIFMPIFQPEADFIAQQAKEVAGLQDTVTLMGADGILADTYITIPETKGMYFSGPASPEGGAYDQLVARYEEKFGEQPIASFHAHAYDAANMLFAAIEQVAQEDDGQVTIDRQKLRDALYATEGFEGLTGTLTCDEFGDCADAEIDVVQNTEQTKKIEDVRANVLFTLEGE
jgi:branched-chain amino acid transport system substrate-binding protein